MKSPLNPKGESGKAPRPQKAKTSLDNRIPLNITRHDKNNNMKQESNLSLCNKMGNLQISPPKIKNNTTPYSVGEIEKSLNDLTKGFSSFSLENNIKSDKEKINVCVPVKPENAAARSLPKPEEKEQDKSENDSLKAEDEDKLCSRGPSKHNFFNESTRMNPYKTSHQSVFHDSGSHCSQQSITFDSSLLLYDAFDMHNDIQAGSSAEQLNIMLLNEPLLPGDFPPTTRTQVDYDSGHSDWCEDISNIDSIFSNQTEQNVPLENDFVNTPDLTVPSPISNDSYSVSYGKLDLNGSHMGHYNGLPHFITTSTASPSGNSSGRSQCSSPQSTDSMDSKERSYIIKEASTLLPISPCETINENFTPAPNTDIQAPNVNTCLQHSSENDELPFLYEWDTVPHNEILDEIYESITRLDPVPSTPAAPSAKPLLPESLNNLQFTATLSASSLPSVSSASTTATLLPESVHPIQITDVVSPVSSTPSTPYAKSLLFAPLNTPQFTPTVHGSMPSALVIPSYLCIQQKFPKQNCPPRIMPKTEDVPSKEILLQKLNHEKKMEAWGRVSRLKDEDLLKGEEEDGDTEFMILVSKPSDLLLETVYAMVERMRHIPNALSKCNIHGESALYVASILLPTEPIVPRYIAENLVQLGEKIGEQKFHGFTLIQCVKKHGISHVGVLTELLKVKDKNGRPVFHDDPEESHHLCVFPQVMKNEGRI